MKFCTEPDRNVPRMRCGFPMPCPHHTANGAPRVRVLALIERPEQLRGRSVDVRILGVQLGPRWREVCERFLR